MKKRGAVLGVLLGVVAAVGAAGERLPGGALRYLGAFALPDGDAWAYSGRAMAYRPGGDPAGPLDGHPGSLYVDGHDWDDLVGEVSIPAPVQTTDFAALPRASVLRGVTDVTGGWFDGCNHDDACPGCEFREVAGLAWLGSVGKLAWNLRDWYNAGGCDLESLGWSDPDLGQPEGIWHVGPRPSAGDAYHNGKTCDYLFTAPPAFADQHLGGFTLIAGNHRAAGAFGGSQGPTLYATAPWLGGMPPPVGTDLPATALVYYPEVLACTSGDPAACHFPGYRNADLWGGGAWIEDGDAAAVVIAGLKGLGDNCYGTPRDTCPPDPCSPYQGWHAAPYEAQILLYDPADLAAAAAGTLPPWEVLPYEIVRPAGLVFDGTCPRIGAAAFDRDRRLLYLAESTAGPFGETAVHVFEVRGGLFADGFESGGTDAWSGVADGRAAPRPAEHGSVGLR